jgi:DnaK suppressor protein
MPERSGGDEQRRASEQRELLAEQKRKLWAELREDIFAQGGEELHTQYDIPQDIGELSILDLLADAGLAVADLKRAQLTNLDEALSRLEKGTYGVCEGCGGRIGMERLKLVPFTPCCIEC